MAALYSPGTTPLATSAPRRSSRTRAGVALVVLGGAVAASTALPWGTAHWSNHPPEQFSGWALASDPHSHLFYDQPNAFWGWSVRHWYEGGVSPVAGPALFLVAGAVLAAAGLVVLRSRPRDGDGPDSTSLVTLAAIGAGACGAAVALTMAWNVATWTGVSALDADIGAYALIILGLGAAVVGAGEARAGLAAGAHARTVVFGARGAAVVSLVATSRAVYQRQIFWARHINGIDELWLATALVATASVIVLSSLAWWRRDRRAVLGGCLTWGICAAVLLGTGVFVG